MQNCIPMYEHPFWGMSIAFIRFPRTTSQEVQSHCNQVNPGSVLSLFCVSAFLPSSSSWLQFLVSSSLPCGAAKVIFLKLIISHVDSSCSLTLRALPLPTEWSPNSWVQTPYFTHLYILSIQVAQGILAFEFFWSQKSCVSQLQSILPGLSATISN